MPDSQEPPIREFADRGTLWLLESPENLRGLLQIAAADLAAQLDFTRAERINRSFVPDDLQKQEADLLYRVPFRRKAGEVLIYLLLEHQSRPDRTMGLRLLSYMVQLWEAQKRVWQDAKTPVSHWQLHPIVPVVFYTGKRRWASSLGLDALMEVPEALTDFVPRHEVLFLNLHTLTKEQLTGSAVAYVLRALQVAEEPHEVLQAALQEAVAYLETLPEAAQAEWRRAMHFLLLLIRHKRTPEERSPLYATVTESVEYRANREEVEQMAMTDAQALVAQGRREGRREGRQEGRQEERTELLIELLTAKFGQLPETVTEAVKGFSEQQAKAMLRQALTAETLEELPF